MTRPNTEDMLAIHELIARYNWSFDEGQGDEWASVWTEDGTFRNGDLVFSGHEALRDLAIGSHKALPGIRHHTTDLVANYGESRDVINAKAYVLTTSWADGGGKLFAMILAQLLLVRSADGWRLKSNTVSMMRA